jgi:hypothetical protein
MFMAGKTLEEKLVDLREQLQKLETVETKLVISGSPFLRSSRRFPDISHCVRYGRPQYVASEKVQAETGNFGDQEEDYY